MAGDSEPKRRGWYPHRYGDEGKQSYWDGSEWTGESRPKPSLLAGSGASGGIRSKGALGWVLLAIGLGIVGTLVSGSGGLTALGWALAAVTTLVWAVAAIKARSTLGRILLWLWLLVQVFGWWVLLGPGSSPVGDDITAALMTDIEVELKTWGVSEDSWTCIETGLIEGGYTDDLADLPIRSVFLIGEDPSTSDVPPALEQFREGLFLFLFDPQQGCLPPEEIIAVGGFLSGNPAGPTTDESSEAIVAEFVTVFAGAQENGQIDFLVEHLHPTTFEIWTEEECASSLLSWVGAQIPADIVSMAFVGKFRLDYGDDRYGDSDNTYRVEYDDHSGNTGQMSVSLDAGGPYWFMNCDPLP